VTGSYGQLGSEIKNLIISSEFKKHNFYLTDIDTLDITKLDDIKLFCEKNNITHIINCAAYTAVDKAEEEQKLADLINHKAVENIALVAKEKEISVIHISTDYVFDGKNYKPYNEEDRTNPQSVYGLTKLKGENALKKINPNNSIIIRTSWLYSSYGNNFVKTIIRLGRQRDKLGIIYDQIGTPTYARDLASAVLRVMSYELGVMNEGDKYNSIQNSKLKTQNSVMIYHYSNEGACSWYDFAKAIFEIKQIDVKVSPITTKDYPTPAKRPHYSVLDKSNIKKEFGIIVPYWKESLKRMLNCEF
jgi:dTDP-4-dehydrorhamnose reductase